MLRVNEKEKIGESGNFLAGVVRDLFSSVTTTLTRHIESVLEEQKRKVLRSIVLLIVFFIGAFFALNGLAIYVGEYLKMGNWVGYSLVGLLLIIVGFIFRK